MSIDLRAAHRATLPVAAALLAIACGGGSCAQNRAAQNPPSRSVAMAKSPAWKSVETLISEQKFEEASKAVAAIRTEARAAGNEGDLTRALITEVQLREALHGTETAVRFLRDEAWPADPLSRVTLQLFYAHTLTQYMQMYSWEIGQREKVESKGPVDLKAWTRDQILLEAEKSYQEVWARRAELAREPVSALGDYLKANDYPAGVRDTLRDAITYFAVELLGDSGNWTAEESNELYRVEHAALLARGGKLLQGVRLDDAAVHPVVRAVAALDDLEAASESASRPQAALEARLGRLRLLHTHFSNESERAAQLAESKRLLDGPAADTAWGTMAWAQYAEFLRESGDLVEAHRVAAEGARRQPASPGSRRCLAIAAEIEAPDMSIASMRSDAVGRRSIQVTHKNLGAVFFRAYALDLFARVESARDYNLLPNNEEMRNLVKSGRPVATWKVDLPATPDFKSHVTYVTPPLPKKGYYVILASVREDFVESRNRVVGVNFFATDLVLLTRGNGRGGGIQCTTVAGESGKAEPGVELILYRFDWQKRHFATETRKTDASGQYLFPQAGHDGSYFLIARKGDDVTLGPDGLYFSRPYEEPRQNGVLVYTDRSIYRPLQTIQWKVVGYSGDQRVGRFAVTPNAKLHVVLHDGNGEIVAEKDVTTNAFGTAAGTFAIPAGRLLGGWQVGVDGRGAASIRVEEYKRPTFEVSVREPKGDLRLNQPATLVGEARYYFGLPVTSGSVRYRVTREPVYPWWWGFWFSPRGGQGGSQVITAGTATVDKDGTFKMTFTPTADEREAKPANGSGGGGSGVTYRYALTCDFTDEGGETRSAERSVRLGFVAVEASIAVGDGFLVEGDPGAKGPVTITRTDLDGNPRAGKGSFRVVSLAQPPKTLLPSDQPQPQPAAGSDGKEPFRTPGDLLRPRWEGESSYENILHGWKDGPERAKGELTHDDKGVATAQLPSLPPGPYRLRYETVDPFGAKYENFSDFVVAAAAKPTPLAVPLALKAQRSSVKVGETARFLVASGFGAEAGGQPLYFEIYKDGTLSQRRVLDGRSPLVEIPVKEADRGGFGVVLWGVRDHQLMQATASLMVPWDDKELSLEFGTFRDVMRPGAKETFRITVKGASGKVEAGTAELLAYMYDRSLDYFTPHTTPSPLSLYPGHALVTMQRGSVGQAGQQWVFGDSLVDIPGSPSFTTDQLVFLSGYGIGGPGRRRFKGDMLGRGGAPMMADGAVMAAPPSAPAPAEAAAPAARMAKPMAMREEAEKKNAPADAGGAQPAAARTPPAQVRTNFSETAFFAPQLLTDGKGQVAVEFTVPDSVTSWNVWVHGITKDLRGGSLRKESRTVKELMVRPYLPRFFREGDQVDLKVVVNNAGSGPLSGKLTFELFDPETNQSLLSAFGLAAGKDTEKSFSVEKGGSTNLTFPVTTPRRVGPVAIRAVAKAGDFSDGELRPLPVLPGRMHLMQSRFVTLKDKDKRTMTFDDLAKAAADPTLESEQMVVTVDAQLFYTVLKALPYLIEYPYECTEQTLNRFVSTGIVSSVFKDNPAIAKMAAEMSKRPTRLETWDAADPNRKMALEETPWLNEARGGADPGLPLINVLDPKVAQAQRDEALAKLQKIQTASGGFPWFPGGPPSPYMTLYLTYGFSKVAEFGVDVPKEMVQRAWQYLAAHFREEYVARLKKKDWGWEFLTFLNYTASAYPDESWTGGALTDKERKEILEFSFSHWKEHSPYLKGLLALTLKRMGRAADGKLVFDSVMDSAKTAPDQGTFWAPEDRSWLWYNDTTETHAFALRTLLELSPADARKDGLVLWLLLDKKLNHWKSTRATAEVIYSLVKYMKGNGSLGVREEISVSAPPVAQTFVFQPDKYVGKTQLVIPGDKIDPKTTSTITVEKATKGFAFASATWHFSTEKLPAEARGDFFAVTREYFKRDGSGKEVKLIPLKEGAKLQPGDEVEVHVSLRSKHAAEYVHLRDPRPAGFEPATTVSSYKWDLGLGFYEEVRDSGENFFFEWLPVGEYTFKYRLRAALGGTFKAAPATVQAMYAPEFVAYSAGDVVKIDAASPADANAPQGAR